MHTAPCYASVSELYISKWQSCKPELVFLYIVHPGLYAASHATKPTSFVLQSTMRDAWKGDWWMRPGSLTLPCGAVHQFRAMH